MGGKRILWLVKFFSEEEHADQFLAGGLHLNRLSFFKQIEDQDDITRRDPNEAVWAWLQPDDLIIKITVPGIGEVEITKKDLAAPVSLAFDAHNDLHVYCMYALYIDDIGTSENGKIELSPDQTAKIEAQLLIDNRCLQFGKFAVILLADAFLNRLQEALQKRGQWFRGELVDYYDEETFHGDFAPKDAPFRKQKCFAYQREFRFCVLTNTPGDDPLQISMGDLSDIACKTESRLLNGMFQLNLEPPA